ncbi:hypothetical protein FQN53_007287 [Emmonsiellopsis sp. PD_33]|nr:hypothetical protein FQN53_007287 [Emmonsiellopsis sp. PD_33]
MRKCDRTDVNWYYCVDANVKNVNCEVKNEAIVAFPGDPNPTTVTVIGFPQPTSTSTDASTNTSPSSTATATPTPTDQPRDPGKAAAIGAGVGVSVGVLSIAGIIYFAWRRRHRQRRAMQADQPPGYPGNNKKDPTKNRNLVEAPGQGDVVEAAGGNVTPVGELPGNRLPTSPVELPGS